MVHWLWLSWQSGRFQSEIRGSNPVISKNLKWTYIYYEQYWQD